MSFKNQLKKFLPPILYKIKDYLFKKNNVHIFTGNYITWHDAKINTTGYDADSILEKCKQSLLKVKDEKGYFERDSVLFSRPQYSWPLLVALQHISIKNSAKINIIDFGGSLGSTYYHCKKFMRNSTSIDWTIVEQKNFVTCGKEYFESKELSFQYDLESAIQKQQSQCILLSGVLQYLEKPIELIKNIVSKKIEYIIIDRTSFINDNRRITIQNVSPDIYSASYPAWFFNEKELLTHFTDDYDIIFDFPSNFDSTQISEDNKRLYWNGYFLKLKNDRRN